MNREWLMIAAMGSGGILFAIGGTGPKWVRRFVLPFLLALIASFSGLFIWWKPWAMMLGLMIAFCLGYGEAGGSSYFLKFLIGCCFVAPTLFLGFTAWQIITPVCFLIMFKLSNSDRFASIFVWKIVEFLTGGLIGATVAELIR